MTVEIWWHTID